MKNKLLVDEEWLLGHILPFDGLSFQEQVTLMAETDVLVSVHSAALFNGIFMRPGSAAINIMNGRFIEYVFSPPLRYPLFLSLFLSLLNHMTWMFREAGVELLYVASDDTTRFSNCPADTPQHCFERAYGFDASDIECWKIRQCSVTVDLVDFYRVLMQAYKYVRSAKFS